MGARSDLSNGMLQAIRDVIDKILNCFLVVQNHYRFFAVFAAGFFAIAKQLLGLKNIVGVALHP